MKRLFIAFLFCLIISTGCSNKKEVDYSKYSFTDVNWTRDNGHDIETISFNSDGSFGYSCACGNPVNDADLCESFSYDEERNEIKLNCFETTDETITDIKIVNETDDTIELDFNGELRIFTKQK